MGKYFCVQMKRLRRIILPVLLVSAVLFGCLMVVFDTVASLSEEEGQITKYKIGVVGTANDIYLQLGLNALGSVDSTRFSLELVPMEEAEAEEAMRRGTIAAFVVFPEEFLDSAFRGEIIPLKFVCTAGSIGLVSMIKDELTQMIETMLLESQKGIYGAGDAMESISLNGNQLVNDISIEYGEFVFKRANIYRTSTQEAFGGLGMEGYLATGLSIVLFLLICLTFSPVMIRRDHALGRMLCARGRSVFKQALCDFAVYMIGLFGIAGVILIYLIFWLHAPVTGLMILQALPALLALGAMSFLMYELASDLVSGVLLQFFVTLVLCFLSGCMYPITFFPDAVQTLSGYLPTGMAREQIADCILGIHDWGKTAILLAFGVLFLGIALLVRRFKTSGVRG